MSRMIRKLVCAAGLAAFAGASACHKSDEAAASEEPPTVGAKTIIIAPQAFTETLGAIGTVTGRVGHMATLSAPTSGRISEVTATTGQVVQAGQTLVVLDQAPFQAALLAAEAALANAQSVYDRQKRLAGEGIVPRKDVEQAASDLAKAKADEVAARRNDQLSAIKAPIAGVVTRISATIGATADPAQPLVEIADPKSLDILLSVTPSEAARVRPSARVALSAGQSASGEQLGIGAVADVSATVDSTTRSVNVRVQAPTTRRPLRIGETVFGAIAVATHPAAIVIPPEALVPEGDEFKVFVVDANNIAHATDVKIGGRSAAGVEIIEGLKAGDRIVTYGAYGMQDSSKVVPLAAGDSGKVETPVKPGKP
jgi:membrane fusion protein (multidrug efflux system)